MTTADLTARGSQLQVQIYVNRRPGDLTRAVLDALPSLADEAETIGWVAPLEGTRFQEPQDDSFLRAVGWADLADDLRAFWPKKGPVWDALGVPIFANRRPGVVLAEGKSYPGELRGPGCKAGPESRDRIAAAITRTQEQLGLEPETELWLGEHYQTANRLAHLCWLRAHDVEAWFVHLLFLDDRTHGRPTSRNQWDDAWRNAAHEMRLDKVDTPWFGHAFLDALADEELTRTPLPA